MSRPDWVFTRSMNCALPSTPPQKVSDDMPMISESGWQVITSRIATRMDPRIWTSSASKLASESMTGFSMYMRPVWKVTPWGAIRL